MSNIAGNQRRNPFTLGRVAQSVGDYFTRIKRYDEAKAEYQEAMTAYNRVLQRSPQFASAQNQKGIIQKILDDLSAKQVPVLPRHTVVNDLRLWLKNQFTQAIEAGWRTLEDIFARPIPEFMAAVTIKRAKRIGLGIDDTVILGVELNELDNQKIRVILRLYPANSHAYLPENLKMALLSESGEMLKEKAAGKNNDRIEQPLTVTPGERFSVRLALEDVSVTENFII